MEVIKVKSLKKQFVINKRQSGIKGIIKNLFHAENIVKNAVNELDFTIEKGEIVGFLGPNGAGKSTTVKMLSGILVPTSGEILINNQNPQKNRKESCRKMGVVFGQRTQLWWNLPVRESFELLKTIYKIPDEQYQANVKLFSELLGIDALLDIPVRQLSLGQRMRVEISACLLHNPDVVFLDEPTIGLDVVAKEKIREFIREINTKHQVTILLTTHDMSDIEKLCDRIIIIDKGSIIYDGQIKRIKEMYGRERMLLVDFEECVGDLELKKGRVVESKDKHKKILFNRDEVTAMELVNEIHGKYPLKDFTLQETDIETIIAHIYNQDIVV